MGNTWMGEPVKMLQLSTILDVIDRDDLVNSTARTGATLYAGLRELQAAYPETLKNVRGVGTFCAVDFVAGPMARDMAVAELKTRGIWVGACGEASIRLRPALIFRDHHARIFLVH